MKKNFNAEFKAKIVLEAFKGEKTSTELSSLYEVHRSQINTWRRQAEEQIINAFNGKGEKDKKDNSNTIDELYRQIGQLRVENEWLKKKFASIER
jgi:transposase